MILQISISQQMKFRVPVVGSVVGSVGAMLITIHSTLRASDSPTPDSGTIHYGAHSNGNSNGTRKASRVIIEEAPSNNT